MMERQESRQKWYTDGDKEADDDDDDDFMDDGKFPTFITANNVVLFIKEKKKTAIKIYTKLLIMFRGNSCCCVISLTTVGAIFSDENKLIKARKEIINPENKYSKNFLENIQVVIQNQTQVKQYKLLKLIREDVNKGTKLNCEKNQKFL